ncbi:MAG: protein kinase [bacterium]|nr:protein kinase [bacterium]
MAELVESRYGFIFVEHSRNHHYVDLYLPKSMLTQLQLVPGSGVLVQGLGSGSSDTLQVRPEKGSEKYPTGYSPFIATIRFRNQVGVLRRFLASARDHGILFELLNTRGLRGKSMTDVLCEGVVAHTEPYFDPGKAIAAVLEKAAKPAGGDVLMAFPIDYKKPKNGKVLFSSYRTKIPILRGSYGKVRVDTQGSGRPFKHFEGEINILRVELDRLRLTLTLDTSFSDLQPYILYFNAVDIDPASPITQTILEVMYSQDEEFKVEALEAFEYPEYRAGALTPLGKDLIRPTARVEVLFTRGVPIDDKSSLENILKESLSQEDWCPADLEVEIIDLQETLSKKVEREIPDDTGCSAFQKLLNDERYVFIESIGSGAFGNVSKYFDNRTNMLVAGKHITDAQFALESMSFIESEIRALELARKEQGIKNLVAIQDHFYDGEMPFIVMELVENILEDHAANPASVGSSRRHSVPSDIGQFMEMARQTLGALGWLHAGGDILEEGILHSDIKPSNIGFNLNGSDIVWKLLDFGLAKNLPKDVLEEKTQRIAGTPAYMSPQALLGRKLESNDIYALGIVLFQAAFGWQHPSIHYKSPEDYSSIVATERLSFVPEVTKYAVYARNKQEESVVAGGAVPKEFARKDLRFAITFPDACGPEAQHELANLIYNMVKFSTSERPSTASEAREALDEWASQYLP